MSRNFGFDALESGSPLPRRDWLRQAGLGAGGLLAAGSQAFVPHAMAAAGGTSTADSVGGGTAFGKARAVILFCLVGGPPQHETWDPKPNAPKEIRGEFGSIATRTPGLSIGELMPKTATLTDRIAVLRAVVSGDNAHSSSGYQMLTGVPHIPPSRENVTAAPPNIWPSLGAIVRYLRPHDTGLPAAVTLPRYLANVGEIFWPGQDAGFLGRRFDPWLLVCDPSEPNFRIPDLSLPEGVDGNRFARRRELLARFERERSGALDPHAEVAGYARRTSQALGLMGDARGSKAFDLSEEPDAVRDRYGRGKFAQSVLLARRLVEAGTTLVQVNWQRIEGKENFGGWDTHKAHNACLKEFLMPLMDQAFTALLEDLEDRGLLDSTLVVWNGEFGRTPKFNANAGRDHWGRVYSLALAGGGVRGGVVHGASDGQAADPVSGRVEPADIAATLFHLLGHDPETPMRDPQGRAFPISRGHVIREVL